MKVTQKVNIKYQIRGKNPKAPKGFKSGLVKYVLNKDKKDE